MRANNTRHLSLRFADVSLYGVVQGFPERSWKPLDVVFTRHWGDVDVTVLHERPYTAVVNIACDFLAREQYPFWLVAAIITLLSTRLLSVRIACELYRYRLAPSPTLARRARFNQTAKP